MTPANKFSPASLLRRGGVGIVPTDTVYGILGSAIRKETVERIYVLRKRNPDKPFIILIASKGDIARFGVKLSSRNEKILERLWPGKVSVILPCVAKKLAYLHRGKNQLAFRLPENASLRALLKKTGPLVAPSANIEGEPVALTIKEAKDYFGKTVDFYVNGGKLISPPSTLVMLEGKRLVVLRKGAENIERLLQK